MLVEVARSAAWLVLSPLSAFCRMPLRLLVMAAPSGPATRAGRQSLPYLPLSRRSQATARDSSVSAWSRAARETPPRPALQEQGQSALRGSAGGLQPLQVGLRQRVADRGGLGEHLARLVDVARYANAARQ